jgi:hypothetical protein
MTPIDRMRASAVLAALAVAGCSGDGSGPSADIPETPEATESPEPRLTVELQARPGEREPWAGTVTARPGQVLRFRMVIRNRGATAERTQTRLELDRGLNLVAASPNLRRSEARGPGAPLPPGLARGGVPTGRIRPGNATLLFAVRVAQSAATPSRLRAGAVVTSPFKRTADTATVRVRRR